MAHGLDARRFDLRLDLGLRLLALLGRPRVFLRRLGRLELDPRHFVDTGLRQHLDQCRDVVPLALQLLQLCLLRHLAFRDVGLEGTEVKRRGERLLVSTGRKGLKTARIADDELLESRIRRRDQASVAPGRQAERLFLPGIDGVARFRQCAHALGTRKDRLRHQPLGLLPDGLQTVRALVTLQCRRPRRSGAPGEEPRPRDRRQRHAAHCGQNRLCLVHLNLSSTVNCSQAPAGPIADISEMRTASASMPAFPRKFSTNASPAVFPPATLTRSFQ